MTWRKLKHNKSTQIARTLLFVDTETRTTTPNPDNLGPNKLWFGVVRSGRFVNDKGSTTWARQDSSVFKTQEEFWTYAKTKARKRETTWIYAHNAGFDFVILGLLRKLANGELTLTKPGKRRKVKGKEIGVHGLLMLEDPPTVIGVQDSDGCRYVLVDTLNYWRIALSSLGKSIGYDKIDMPVDCDDFSRWVRYCNRDAEVIERAVVQLITWWREMDLGNWKWTAPGLAWSAYRHKFMNHEIVFHDEMPVRKLERDSYYGGQLEAYHIGDINEPVFQYDVVSLYPSVMTGNLFPTKLKAFDVTRKLSVSCPFEDATATISEVEIDTEFDTFPTRANDIVYYANGFGRLVLAGPELKYAIERGYIRRFGAFASYTMAPIFTEYVSFFYELKERYEVEGKTIQRNFVKLLLNSLYGKFAQRGGKWQYNPDRMPMNDFGLFYDHSPFGGAVQKCLGIMDVVFDWCPKKEIESAAPSISSFVTSYARQKMRALKRVCGDGNYFYMSTDSLLVNEQAKDNLEAAGDILGSGLGKLKLEVAAESAWIGGLHYYRVGEKLVEGSKKRSGTTTVDGAWDELQFDSLLAVVERTKTRPDLMDAIDIRKVTKHRKGVYEKGHVMDSGSVTPFELSELQ